METTLTEVSPVERTLEIEAAAAEVEPRLDRALRAQRKNIDLKGSRKGKAPLSLVKKMYGQALGYQVAEQFVQEAFEQEVVEPGAVDVLGRPQMTELDYEAGQALRAVIRFAVRPEVELKDLSPEDLPRLKHAVTDEEVEEELERLRRRHADLMPTDEPAAETSYVTFDLQEIDPETDTPIVGRKDEEQALFLDSPQIEDNPMLQELRDALLGTQPGDTVRFTFSHDAAHGEHAAGHVHAHRFEAVVHEVKRRELPEVDAAFIEEATDGEFADVEVFRQEIRHGLEEAWDERAREMMQGQLVGRMLELHPMPIPQPLADTFLDSFVEDVKRRNDGELPADFDETHFRIRNRPEAEQQAHWMLLRDQVVTDENLEATDADRQAFFEEQAAQDPQMTAAQLEQFYRSMPQIMSQIEQQVLSRKVFDVLEERFTIVEKDREAFQQDMEAEQQVQQAQAQQEAPAEESAADESVILTPGGRPASTRTVESEAEAQTVETEDVPAEEEPADGYEAMTKDELNEIAREADLAGRSSMTRDELIEALRAHPDV